MYMFDWDKLLLEKEIILQVSDILLESYKNCKLKELDKNQNLELIMFVFSYK